MKTLVALVGMKHRGTEALVASLPQGEPLTLIRERSNRFDRNAVQVWARDQHVGYLRATQVLPITVAMDQAYMKYAPVHVKFKAQLAIDGGRWPLVEIDLPTAAEIEAMGFSDPKPTGEQGS